MSVFLNLTALPILGVTAVVLMYCQLGFIITLLIAIWRTFKNFRNIQYIVLYIFLLLLTTGMAYGLMKLTFIVAELANNKIWGYISAVVLSLFGAWKIIPQFIRVASEQTSGISRI